MSSVRGESWSSEALEKLKNLWLTSATAKQIGIECGGRSKLSVIGKANRLNLGPKPKVERLPLSVEQFEPAERVIEARVNIVVEELPLPLLQLRLPESLPFYFGLADAMETLKVDTCRWPCGCAEEPNFHFCGAKTGGTYCAEHNIIA